MGVEVYGVIYDDGKVLVVVPVGEQSMVDSVDTERLSEAARALLKFARNAGTMAGELSEQENVYSYESMKVFMKLAELAERVAAAGAPPGLLVYAAFTLAFGGEPRLVTEFELERVENRGVKVVKLEWRRVTL